MSQKNIPKNLINILKNQHNHLRKEMKELKEESEKSSPNFPILFKILNDFSYFLAEHLNLENNVFYPELIEKFKMKGHEIYGIEKFINEMKIIETKVKKFFKFYLDAENIKKDFKKFALNLDEIVSTLTLRIESEENSVFYNWDWIR